MGQGVHLPLSTIKNYCLRFGNLVELVGVGFLAPVKDLKEEWDENGEGVELNKIELNHWK